MQNMGFQCILVGIFRWDLVMLTPASHNWVISYFIFFFSVCNHFLLAITLVCSTNDFSSNDLALLIFLLNLKKNCSELIFYPIHRKE